MSEVLSIICQVSDLSPVKSFVNNNLKLRGKQVLLPNYHEYMFNKPFCSVEQYTSRLMNKSTDSIVAAVIIGAAKLYVSQWFVEWSISEGANGP